MLLVALALAQEVRALTLAEALALHEDASETLRIAESDVERARADKAVAAGGFLPQVSGSAVYTHTFQSEYDAIFGAAGGDTGQSATGGLDLIFAAENTYRLGVTVSETVYGGGRVHAQNRMAAAGRRLADLGLVSARAAAKLQVAQAYFDAQFADELLAIATAALAQAETTEANARAAHQVGRQPEFEVLRARVEVEGQRVVVIQQQRLRSVAHLRLRQLLGLPADATLQLTTPLGDESTPVPPAEGGERALVRQAELAVEAAQAGVALTRSAGLPQAGVSLSGGLVVWAAKAVPESDSPSGDFLTATAQLSVPIFNGGVVRAQIDGAQADVAAARARLAQAREIAELDTQDALAALGAARASWEATASSVAQAERAYAIGEVRFQEGISTQAELSDARLLLQRARANRAQAGRDLQLAALRARLLNDLPPVSP